MSSVSIEQGVPLAPRTTLGLGGPAEYFTIARTEEDLKRAVRWARDRDCDLSLLAGGSNVLVPDEGVSGLVVLVALEGLAFEDDGRVRIGAGTVWNDVVTEAVARNLAGVECLAGIPGSSGATPIQNVGAYGQEIAEVVAAVHTLNRESLESEVFDREACGFGYRDSRFKRFSSEYIVTAVELQLVPGGPATVRYPGLAEELSSADPTLEEVRKEVLRVRAKKSMVIDKADPNHRSVGSFFVNPVVSSRRATEVVERCLKAGLVEEAAEVPQYRAAGDGVKLAAAWLIEKAGIERGLRRGAVGVSTRHALALVHHGGGTTSELLALADEIAGSVHDMFGVTLDREPRILGAT